MRESRVGLAGTAVELRNEFTIIADMKHCIEFEGVEDKKKCFYVWNYKDMVEEMNEILMEDSEHCVDLIGVFGDRTNYNCVLGSLEWLKNKIKGIQQHQNLLIIMPLL